MQDRPEPAASVSPANVLILDDDREVALLLAAGARAGGHATWVALKATDALNILRSEPISVLVTDIVMPDFDGLEMIQMARRIRPHLRIVAMSGGTQHSQLYLTIANKLGAGQVLNKPFPISLLLEAIARVTADGSAKPARD